MAGGAGNDEIFGQLGNDVIQGDGSIVSKVDGLPGTPAVSAARTNVGGLLELVVVPSFEAASDGDDYIEGNGGDDVVFGNLGQDDIIGGNSSLFSLATHGLRADGTDLLFGGAGTDISRSNAGDTGTTAHARDADAIVGDNGNIFRLVGINNTNGGAFLSFNYDNYDAALKIVPRAVQPIDYTPGGPDKTVTVEPGAVAINPATGLLDHGAADEVHGESGDDVVYGMVGNDARGRRAGRPRGRSAPSSGAMARPSATRRAPWPRDGRRRAAAGPGRARGRARRGRRGVHRGRAGVPAQLRPAVLRAWAKWDLRVRHPRPSRSTIRAGVRLHGRGPAARALAARAAPPAPHPRAPCASAGPRGRTPPPSARSFTSWCTWE